MGIDQNKQKKKKKNLQTTDYLISHARRIEIEKLKNRIETQVGKRIEVKKKLKRNQGFEITTLSYSKDRCASGNVML
jgi:hypothetical protein